MYRTRSNPRNINMKSLNSHILHSHHNALHIITPPHMRVIVPEHQTRSAILNIINPRGVLRQRVITFQTGPV